jgi:hypothetical protein
MKPCSICKEPETRRLKIDLDTEGISICDKPECEEKARLKILIILAGYDDEYL